ncbi:MAG: 50S ribosomal protein L30 [Dehalococcoidia bacterium]|nr:50S ribosomal protein L30 [Dehalococcoidia bacterium]
MSKIKITLRRSGIGFKIDQKRTIKALGLRRLNYSVIVDDNRTMRGMAIKIRHLVDVEELSE